MNTEGTFYGCHNFELFKLVLSKIDKQKKEFILIVSGSSEDKIINYCVNNIYIREVYIYCFFKEKYLYLLNKYNKLRGVFNIFSELKEKLNEIKETKNNIIVKSDNLFYFEEYLETYVKLHYEIIKKYDIYSILRSKGFTEEEFKKGIKMSNY